MDIMPFQLLTPLGNVEPTLNDQEMSFLHQVSLQQMAEVFEEGYQKTPFSFKSPDITMLDTFSSSVVNDKPNLGTSRLATNFLKVENEDTYTTKQVSVMAQGAAKSPKYLSFGNPDSLSDLQQLYMNGVGEPKEEMKFFISKKPRLMNHDISSFQTSGRARMGNNPHSSSRDHMIAERKRREKLNEQFLSLSAIIPGLAKTDKASLLVSTINYLKELVTKVKSLEESIVDGPVESAAVLMKDDKASLISDESSSSDPLIKIEAKLTGKKIVIKFQCKNLRGLAIKALFEIEKLFLTIIDLSIMPFASSSLDVVVMAKVDDGFSLTVKELVEKLSSFFSKFI